MTEILPSLTCREMSSFDATNLDAVCAAFASADVVTMQQAWSCLTDSDFAPATVRVGWRGDTLLVFAELDDAEVFTHATAHNQRMWELGDTLEIFLAVEKYPSYVEFHVTPNNHRLQLRIPNAEVLHRARETGALDEVLLVGKVFDSNTWVMNEKWSVYAAIPARVVCGASQLFKGTQWRFSFSRYDYVRGRNEPIISSTSPHAKPDFHRREEWGVLNFA